MDESGGIAPILRCKTLTVPTGVFSDQTSRVTGESKKDGALSPLSNAQWAEITMCPLTLHQSIRSP
jgi:hypothetical protein